MPSTPPPSPSPATPPPQASARIALALGQLQATRRYTLLVLQNTDRSVWFETPAGLTNVAWQVGHIAFGQWANALVNLRGPRPEDDRLFPMPPADFQARYGKGSTPNPLPAQNVSPDHLVQTLSRVLEQVALEWPGFPESRLEEKPERPHQIYTTKWGAMLWASQHEMLHAGQTGLLRRLLGLRPYR